MEPDIAPPIESIGGSNSTLLPEGSGQFPGQSPIESIGDQFTLTTTQPTSLKYSKLSSSVAREIFHVPNIATDQEIVNVPSATFLLISLNINVKKKPLITC